MPNPDRGYGDDNDTPAWAIVIFIILSILAIVFAIINKDSPNQCTAYYQGDELVDNCSN